MTDVNFHLLDWDAWRAEYDAMTYQDQQAFYDEVFDTYPVQRAYDPLLVGGLLTLTRPKTVLEFGGWTGDLARDLLPGMPWIESWTNVDCSRKALAASVCDDPRYRPRLAECWLWEEEWSADFVVASHVIEHIRAKELAQLLRSVKCRALYLEAPLRMEPTDWSGYAGSHILEIGWAGVDGLAGLAGYVLAERGETPNGVGSLYGQAETMPHGS